MGPTSKFEAIVIWANVLAIFEQTQTIAKSVCVNACCPESKRLTVHFGFIYLQYSWCFLLRLTSYWIPSCFHDHGLSINFVNAVIEAQQRTLRRIFQCQSLHFTIKGQLSSDNKIPHSCFCGFSAIVFSAKTSISISLSKSSASMIYEISQTYKYFHELG
uniref:Uncharacterized protein n=2 Tax=Spongospora subterranea TaxID=70186 RepID=A0A0H5QNW7_9EUKA|eukprot:CRZ03723.1 hypothetical protein [Spongospora subterranea]